MYSIESLNDFVKRNNIKTRLRNAVRHRITENDRNEIEILDLYNNEFSFNYLLEISYKFSKANNRINFWKSPQYRNMIDFKTKSIRIKWYEADKNFVTSFYSINLSIFDFLSKQLFLTNNYIYLPHLTFPNAELFLIDKPLLKLILDFPTGIKCNYLEADQYYLNIIKNTFFEIMNDSITLFQSKNINFFDKYRTFLFMNKQEILKEAFTNTDDRNNPQTLYTDSIRQTTNFSHSTFSFKTILKSRYCQNLFKTFNRKWYPFLENNDLTIYLKYKDLYIDYFFIFLIFARIEFICMYNFKCIENYFIKILDHIYFREKMKQVFKKYILSQKILSVGISI